jgi:serine/threonine protein phosphatase PrpC
MGNLLGSPVTEKETHTGTTSATDTSPALKWGMSSMQGWRVHMEDAHITEGNLYALVESSEDHEDDNNNIASSKKILLPGHALFAVFDGHGGTFSAEYAGKNFLRVLSHQPKFIEYARSYETADKQTKQQLLEQALHQAFVETDYEIASAIRGHPHPQANQEYRTPEEVAAATNRAATAGGDAEDTDTTMRDAASRAAADHVHALDDDGDSGTTACMVLVTPDALVCANAGDSRAIFSRKNSQGRSAIPLSYDHKPDDEPEERRIRAAGGYVAGGRVEGDLAVSRGLGDFRFKHMPTVLNNTQLLVLAEQENKNNSDDDKMNYDNHHNHQNNNNLMHPGDQKVSPIPDIVIQPRNADLDEYIIVACDGIWDVQTNGDCVQEVAQMIITEGEQDMGLVCEEVSGGGDCYGITV